MNKQTLKQLTHAHSWLGLILSGALMIVFFCGTLSFFKQEILAWEGYHDKQTGLPEISLSPAQISKIILDKGYDIPADHRVLLLFPTESDPSYRAFFSTETPNGHHKRHALYFDPATGEALSATKAPYYLAEFLYKLHIDLNIPFGTEIVGIVSVLFFVIIISGILIHLKKLFKNFFQYRLKKRKDMYLDGHNLIGVTSLPYTLMYALTGIVFNLSILYQTSFSELVFQGDLQALSQVSGFDVPALPEPSGHPMNWQNIDLAVEHANQALPGAKVYLAKFWGFGDQHAQMQLRLVDTRHVSERLTIDYPLDNYLNYQAEHVLDNPVQASYHIFKQLHYGSFGGITLQFIYFLLGLGCCYLILSGNLIWLEKRSTNRKQSQQSFNVVRAMTLGLSVGVLIAVGLCFAAARILPDAFAQREALPVIFSSGLLISFVHALWHKCATQVMVQQAIASAFLFAIAPLYDTALILSNKPTLGNLHNLILINLVSLLVSAFCLIFARYKYQSKHSILTQSNQAKDEMGIES